eukprot:scaffold9783_cov57-Phaeocystis_antarctica.AAC.1
MKDKTDTPDSSLELEIKAFAKQLVHVFSLGADAARFSVVSFAENATLIESGIDAISADGETSISDGFALARELFADDGNGSRTNAAKIVLFVSDGEQTVDAADDKTLFQTAVDAAQLVKDLPATVFAWGVGDNVSLATLKAIATSPSDVNAVTAVLSKDVAGLVDYLAQLEAAVCNESPHASPPPPSPPPPSPSPPP